MPVYLSDIVVQGWVPGTPGAAAAAQQRVQACAVASSAALTTPAGDAGEAAPDCGGGGISVDHSWLTLVNCVVQGHRSGGSGGGLHLVQSTLQLQAVTIQDNMAVDGGAIAAVSSDATIR